MPLTPGSRIGSYEIVSAIGAGGMGEVFRARDTKLHRDVAIKVLPDLFARDPERLARFEREARTLAALNHPNIAHVYGTVDLPPNKDLPPKGGSYGSAGLVMELVEGDDLSHRIERGRIPLDEALPIALQIAEGLQAAHDQGIVHRDLKPGNVKVRVDGTVKILDFGLAKAFETADVAGPHPPENSPTITTPFQMSRLGVILGTAAYMAPEQARGKAVDKRADIWAFGCVLYEMLTGARAFPGEDVTDTLAAIVRAEPDWAALPADTPPSIRKLLRRCLEKDPRERLPDIGAARLELKDARSAGAVERAPVTLAARPVAWLPWALAGAASVAAIAAIAYALGKPAPAADTRVYKSVIVPPAPLSGAPALRLALSPDGSKLAFVAPDPSGSTMLWVRPLDGVAAQALPGTVNASAPFWSPDSKSIGFLASGRLRRIDAVGGPVLVVCDAAETPPGTWSRDDVIVFSGLRGPLSRVPATGGKPVPQTESTGDPNDRLHISPWFLPDGRRFLFTAGPGASRQMTLSVGSLDSTQTTKLLQPASNAQYANGYVLYLRDTTLLAHRFDPDTLKFAGDPVPIAVDVQINPSTGTGAFSVSQNGTLVYQTGASAGTRLTWFDRKGNDVSVLGTQSGVRDVQLSPDGKWASATLPGETSDQPDVWLFDVASGARRRFTFGGAGSMDAVWSADSRSVAYASVRGQARDLFRKSVGGAGAEELLWRDADPKYPLGFSGDGRFLIYFVPNGAATGRVWLLPLQGGGASTSSGRPEPVEGRKPRLLLPALESQAPAEVSPDSRWIAYVSDDSGRREVYVTSFPDAAGRWQVSTSGGETPHWRHDGKELFFTSGAHFMSVDVTTSGQEFSAGAPRTLFDVRVPAPALGTRSTYAMSPDGQRFLFNTWDRDEARAPITLVVNWPATIRK